MPLAEKLSLSEALAEISKMPVASLEGVFDEYVGRTAFHNSATSVSSTHNGSDLSMLLSKEQLTIEVRSGDGGESRTYFGPGALDGKLRVTKASLPDGVVTYSLSGQVWQNRRMYHFSLTVSNVKR